MKYCGHPNCGELADFEYQLPPVKVMQSTGFEGDIDSMTTCSKHLSLVPFLLEDIIEFRFHRIEQGETE